MTEFRKGSQGGSGSDKEEKTPLVGGLVRESRCLACMHPQRDAIDKMIALGTSYSEIERLTGVPRHSVSNHAKRHLKYEEGAIRRIIENESARMAENEEDGISGALARRVYLETALKQAQRALVEGDVIVEPKDAANIIALLDKQDMETSGAAIDEIKLQFNAILQAISEVVPQEFHAKIAERARDIADADGLSVKALEDVIDADIVDEDESS